MSPTFRLGRLAGVEIGANWTWLLVVALVAWSLAGGVFPAAAPGLSGAAYAAMAALAVPVFFACLLLHELGHAIQARRDGMAIEGITLWVFGGVARFRGSFPSAGAELRIAIAGPLVSLALGLLFLLVSLLAPLPAAVDAVTSWLGTVNLMLLAFNMLPALPLDGGRVLRALLWRAKGDFGAATRAAAGLGRLFGRLLVGGGVLLALFTGSFDGVWLALIGWFLVLAAEAEREAALVHVALGGLRVRDVMVAHPVTVDADLPLALFMDDVFARTRHVAYPVLRDGAPAGLIAFPDVAAIPRRGWTGMRAGDRARSLDDIVVVAPGDPLEEAWQQLALAPLERALVLDGGLLAGLLSATDVARLIAAGFYRPERQRTPDGAAPRPA